MANIIQLKRGTGSSVPANGSLAVGELAINIDSGKLFYGSGSSVLSDFKFDRITAETYVISSSVSVITTSFSSGSTAFGDSAGDTHTFTGDITASGDISASGNLYAADYFDDGTNINTIYSPIAGHANIVTVGTIGTGEWNATAIPSAKLDADTAHLTTTQTFSGAKTFTLPVTASSHISSSATITANAFIGNITGDLTGEADTVATIAGLAPNTATTQATQGAITSLGTLTGLNVNGQITASGKVSSSNIIYGSAFYSHGNIVGLYHAGSTTIRLGQSGKSTSIYGSDITMGAPVTSSAHISSSANVYAADYFDNGANISTIYSPIAGHANIVTVGTITNGTWNAGIIAEAKLQNQSGTNTGDETTARVNALNITEVGALDDGTIASGFGTINSGEITATSIKHSISGNNAGNYGPGAEILYGISDDSVAAGVIYTLRAGTWTLIDASDDNRVDRLCAVATVAAGNGNSSNGMIIKGCVTLASAFTAGTDVEGVQVYASETGGEATITAPSDSGDMVRILGYSLDVSDKKMFFNPDSTYVEIA